MPAPAPRPAAVSQPPGDLPGILHDVERLSQAVDRRRRELVLLREWQPVLDRLGLGETQRGRAAQRALAHGTSMCRELLVSAGCDEADLFGAIAQELGLPFMPDVEPAHLHMRESQRRLALASRLGPRIVRFVLPGDRSAWAIADADLDFAAWRRRLARRPDHGGRLSVAMPTRVRAAVLALSSHALMYDAQYDLFVRRPDLSARIVTNGWQGAAVAALAILLPLAFLVAPSAAMLGLQIAAATAFFACVVLRLLALRDAHPPRIAAPPEADPAGLPVYSVLVALYRERAVLGQLLLALGRLQWPRGKLEIKLVCEADDRETIDALRAMRLDACVEIVEVPPGEPRTKPKALAYALPLCSGDFVTLYDAEDRPHPGQLLEAWQAFRSGGGRLACVQAPLFVTNGDASLLARTFAFEYAALFRGLLPWLAARGLVLPLGGTSNHFRRAALLDAGGWDSHNVTEDADLGIRLKRFGYEVGVISSPTFEDGPENLATWLPQRTRWFKGWIQTWLVHMRDARRLAGDLGAPSLAVMQILFAGMIVSALIHPLFVASVLYGAGKVAWSGNLNSPEAAVAAFGFVNILLGYGAFVALGVVTLGPSERKGLYKAILATPLHWMLLSVAAWRAIIELYRWPHRWNKTPHARARPLSLRTAPPPMSAPAPARL